MANRLSNRIRSYKQQLEEIRKNRTVAEQKEEKRKKRTTVIFSLLFLSVVFFVIWRIFGFSFWLLGIYLGALAFILLWAVFSLEGKGTMWISIIMSTSLTLVGLIGGSPKDRGDKPILSYKDSSYVKQNEITKAPDGKILSVKTTESVYVRTLVLNSSGPIAIRHIMEWAYHDIDDKPLKALKQYNDVIGQFEKDALHFKVNPDQMRQDLANTYEWEDLEKMSDKKLFRLWSKDPENELTYYYSHSEYLGLVATAYINRGVIYDRLGYPEKALEDYFKGDGLSSRPIRHSNRAMAYAHMGNYEKALWIIEEPISGHRMSENSKSEAYFYKGYILLLMDNIPDARTCFEKAVELNESYAEAHNYLGILNYRERQFEQAVDEFSKAINYETRGYLERADISDEDKLIYYGWAAPYYQNRALAYRALGQIENARADEAIVALVAEKE